MKFDVNFTLSGRATVDAKDAKDARIKVEKILNRIQDKTENVNFYVSIDDVEKNDEE